MEPRKNPVKYSHQLNIIGSLQDLDRSYMLHNEQKDNQRYLKAIQLIKSPDTEKRAIKKLEKVVSQKASTQLPPHSLALNALGLFYLKKGDKQAAKEYFGKSHHPEALVKRAEIAMEEHDFECAKKLLNFAQQQICFSGINPYDPSILMLYTYRHMPAFTAFQKLKLLEENLKKEKEEIVVLPETQKQLQKSFEGETKNQDESFFQLQDFPLLGSPKENITLRSGKPKKLQKKIKNWEKVLTLGKNTRELIKNKVITQSPIKGQSNFINTENSRLPLNENYEEELKEKREQKNQRKKQKREEKKGFYDEILVVNSLNDDQKSNSESLFQKLKKNQQSEFFQLTEFTQLLDEAFKQLNEKSKSNKDNLKIVCNALEKLFTHLVSKNENTDEVLEKLHVLQDQFKSSHAYALLLKIHTGGYDKLKRNKAELKKLIPNLPIMNPDILLNDEETLKRLFEYAGACKDPEFQFLLVDAVLSTQGKLNCFCKEAQSLCEHLALNGHLKAMQLYFDFISKTDPLLYLEFFTNILEMLNQEKDQEQIILLSELIKNELQRMEKLAEKNCVVAEEYGLLHIDGIDQILGKNSAKGLEVLNKNIEKGHGHTAWLLGTWHLEGKYVAKDENKALDCFLIALKSKNLSEELIANAINKVKKICVNNYKLETLSEIEKLLFSHKRIKEGLDIFWAFFENLKNRPNSSLQRFLEDVGGYKYLEEKAEKIKDPFSQILLGFVKLDRAVKERIIDLREQSLELVEKGRCAIKYLDEELKKLLGDYYFIQAYFNFIKGNIERSEKFGLIARDYGNKEFIYILGMHFLDFVDKQELFEKGLRYIQDSSKGTLFLADFYLKKTESCEKSGLHAKEILADLLQKTFDKPEAEFFRQYLLAKMEQREFSADEFVRSIEPLLKEGQQNDRAWYAQGLSYYFTQNYKDAFACFTKASKPASFAEGMEGLMLYKGEGVEQNMEKGLKKLYSFVKGPYSFSDFESQYIINKIIDAFEILAKSGDLVARQFCIDWFFYSYENDRQDALFDMILNLFGDGLEQVLKLPDKESKEWMKCYSSVLNKLKKYEKKNEDIAVCLAPFYFRCAKEKKELLNEPFDEMVYYEKAFPYVKAAVLNKSIKDSPEFVLFEQIFFKLYSLYDNDTKKLRTFDQELEALSFDPTSFFAFTKAYIKAKCEKDIIKKGKILTEGLLTLAKQNNIYAIYELALIFGQQNYKEGLKYFENALSLAEQSNDKMVWGFFAKQKPLFFITKATSEEAHMLCVRYLVGVLNYNNNSVDFSREITKEFSNKIDEILEILVKSPNVCIQDQARSFSLLKKWQETPNKTDTFVKESIGELIKIGNKRNQCLDLITEKNLNLIISDVMSLISKKSISDRKEDIKRLHVIKEYFKASMIYNQIEAFLLLREWYDTKEKDIKYTQNSWNKLLEILQRVINNNQSIDGTVYMALDEIINATFKMKLKSEEAEKVRELLKPIEDLLAKKGMKLVLQEDPFTK
jgi:hypothetical protein